MSRPVPGRDALAALAPGSGSHSALSAALAAAEREAARTEAASGLSAADIRGRSRADVETRLGHPVDVIAIRCTGHAVNGKVKRPRIGYAVRLDIETGWYFGGTLSAALDVETNAARSPWANAVRSESFQAKQESGDERGVVFCSHCPDRFVFADGLRAARALVSFLEEGKHTVTIAELRSRY